MHAVSGFCGSLQLRLCHRRLCALGGSPRSLQAVVQAGSMASNSVARFGTCERNGRREALSGPDATPSGSGGSSRWSSTTVGSDGAMVTFCLASNGRRHAHIVPFYHRKKNACNGRLDGRLGESGRVWALLFPTRESPPLGAVENMTFAGSNHLLYFP